MFSSGMSAADLTVVVGVSAAVLLAALAGVRLASRSGLPSLLVFLGLGLLLGESGAGIRFDDAALTQVLGYAALILILAEGGLTTSWRSIRPALGPAVALSTIGVVVSVVVVAAFAHWLLGWSWPTALLIGAILASTDAAAVFSVLRGVPLRARPRGILEAEAGFNDAPVVLLVVTLSDISIRLVAPEPIWQMAGTVALELLGGAAVGAAVGWLGVRFVRWGRSASGLISIGVVAVAVLAYAVAASIHTSGFLATYICALVLGNSRLPHRGAIHGFAAAVGWLAQIGLFVLLGLLASPGRLDEQAIAALVVGTVLLFLGRPLSVWVSTAPFGLRWREQAFLSWAGLRGAVPVVLATVPVTMGSWASTWIFDLVFVLVVAFTAVQAPTLPWVARRLGMLDAVATMDVDLEVVVLEEAGAEVVQVSIGSGSRLAGVMVRELRLPPEAKVALLIRRTERVVPHGSTILRVDDRLLVVTTAAARPGVEARILAVSERGRLAGWH